MNSEFALPVVLELLVKSALIAVAAASLVHGWRGATSAQRHLVWLVALAAILLLPCTRLAAPRWPIPLQPAKQISVALPASAGAPSTDLLETIPLAEVPSAPPRIRVPIDWRRIVLALWLGGAAAVLGYRLFGSWRVRCLYRRSVPVEDGRVRLLMARTAAELGLRRRVEVRLSEECRVPITWGTWRPVMLLPREALAWSDAWLTAALRHEAAHILRHDDLTRWFAWIACALYWPNPVIWIAARSLRVTQEQAADDLVLSSGTPAEEYAAQLVDAARLVATRGLFARHAVAMACPSTLEDRIVAIVDGQRDRRPLNRFAAAIGSTAGLLTLVLCTAAQLQGADEKPTSTAEPKAARAFGPEIEIEAKFVELPSKDGEVSSDLDKLTVLSDPQFQVILRALNQKKGVDILSSPRVTTHANQRAVMEIIREFRYPTAWKQENGVWTPTEFDTKNVGTTMEVEPQLKQGGALVLRTTASVVEFLGFVDLDDAKALPAPKDALTAGQGHMPQVPPGRRYQTVFSERKKVDVLELKSGETMVIPNLPETAEVKPFEQNAPHGKLIVFLSARLLDVAPPPGALPTADETKEAAAHIVIPKLEFRDATLQEAVAYLQQKVAEASGDKPISIIAAPPVDADPPKITVSLTQIPLTEAVKYLAGLANLPLDFRPGAIVIGSADNLTGFGTPNISGRTLTLNNVNTTITTPPNSPKPLRKPINIQADSAQLDRKTQMSTYAGHVRMSWQRYTMTADTLYYNPATKTAHLIGNVEVANDLNVIQAEDVEITLEGDGEVRVQGPHKTIIRSATPSSAAEKQVNDLTLKSFAAMLEGQQLQAAGKFSEAQTKLREAKETLAQIKTADVALEQRLNQLRQRIAEQDSAFSTGGKGSPVASGNPAVEVTSQTATFDQKTNSAVFSGDAAVKVNRPGQEAMVVEADKLKITGVRNRPLENAALKQAREIILPKVELREASLVEAVDFLRAKAAEATPDKVQVNVVLKPGVRTDATITLSLTNVSFIEALRYAATLANNVLVAEPEALVIEPAK